MSAKTFTHKELAQRLNVSETTIKSYRRKFPGCIPVFSQGKPIRFTQEALAVCKLIRDLFEQGMSVQEVAMRLGMSFPELQEALRHVLAPCAAPDNVGQDSVVPEANDGKPAATEGACQGLSQSFSTAIGGLAQSVVSLTRQQSAILERLTGLEEKMLALVTSSNGQASLPEAKELVRGQGSAVAAAKPQKARADAENDQPRWADELAGRLEGMEQAILQTLQSLDNQFKEAPSAGAAQNAVNAKDMRSQLLEDAKPETCEKQTGKGNVLPWKESILTADKNPHLSDVGAQNSQPQSPDSGVYFAPNHMSGRVPGHMPGHAPRQASVSNPNRPSPPLAAGQHGNVAAKDLSRPSSFKTERDDLEDYLRRISTLPLALKGAEGYTGLAGRGPFSLNDFKAILAQTFMPPQHYVGRWEAASGEFWYILEQPEEKDAQNSIRLHLCPVQGTRGAPMLEVVRFLVGGSHEHPTALYAFVQELLG